MVLSRVKLFLIYFCVSLLVFSLCLIIHYPGIVSVDIFFSLESSFIDETWSNWFSYLHQIFLYFCYTLDKSLSFIGVLQILLLSTCLAFGFSFFNQSHRLRYLCIGLFIWLIASPINLGLVVHYQRDVSFAQLRLLLFLLVFMTLFNKKYLGKSPAKTVLVFTALLTVITSLLRQEALLILPICACIYYFFFKDQQNLLRYYLGSLIGCFLLFYVFIPSFLRIESQLDVSHRLSATINPLSYIIVNNGKNISHEDKAVINEIIEYEDLIKYYNPYDIDPFHKSGFKSFSQEQADKYFRVYLKIVLDNLYLFFENRISVFGSTLGLNIYTFYFNDNAGTEFFHNNFPGFDNKPNSLWPLLKEKHYRLINDLYGLSKIIFAASVLQILFLLFALCPFKTYPITAAMSALMLFRLPIVFFLSPANHFTYLYDLYLAGFFIVPMIVLEHQFKFQPHSVEIEPLQSSPKVQSENAPG